MAPLPLGTSVRVDGLNSVQHNGKTGVVVGFNGDRRVVEIDGDGNQMSLKLANLERWIDVVAVEGQLHLYQGWLRKGQLSEDTENFRDACEVYRSALDIFPENQTIQQVRHSTQRLERDWGARLFSSAAHCLFRRPAA